MAEREREPNKQSPKEIRKNEIFHRLEADLILKIKSAGIRKKGTYFPPKTEDDIVDFLKNMKEEWSKIK